MFRQDTHGSGHNASARILDFSPSSVVFKNPPLSTHSFLSVRFRLSSQFGPTSILAPSKTLVLGSSEEGLARLDLQFRLPFLPQQQVQRLKDHKTAMTAFVVAITEIRFPTVSFISHSERSGITYAKDWRLDAAATNNSVSGSCLSYAIVCSPPRRRAAGRNAESTKRLSICFKFGTCWSFSFARSILFSLLLSSASVALRILQIVA